MDLQESFHETSRNKRIWIVCIMIFLSPLLLLTLTDDVAGVFGLMLAIAIIMFSAVIGASAGQHLNRKKQRRILDEINDEIDNLEPNT